MEGLRSTPLLKEGINSQNGQTLASLDGKNTVPINPVLGENISIALRVQEKIDDAIMTGSRRGFLRTVSMLNCRKSISAVSGAVPIKELVSRKRLNEGPLSREDVEEISGLPELWKDVEGTLEAGHAPVLGTLEDMQIESYLEEQPQDLPATIHVFGVHKRSENEIVTKLLRDPASLSVEDCKRKMDRNHTFLVLGKDTAGKYVCFQKQGPEIHHSFELRELESLIEMSVRPLPDHVYLSFVVPLESSNFENIEEPAE